MGVREEKMDRGLQRGKSNFHQQDKSSGSQPTKLLRFLPYKLSNCIFLDFFTLKVSSKI